MSGPKVVRIVTREEIEAICRRRRVSRRDRVASEALPTGAARTPAPSDGGAAASAGLDPGMGSPDWGIERVEASRASEARTTEARSILTAGTSPSD